ncbi:RNA polymerase sigma factor [Paenibacillus doosanensis]|uniref:RNA polymerase sigma factor n=1 Tax=Paenibacillus konkukensis TaxID=2020716 RepID=A0ABY4RW64_9BACL|nr:MULTISPECIES: RNA polymerase sigma factor [Paenibacillus]MCS7458582.1 RNA polymerase sigma factor [Paenibacillus doosanensis]UQZ86896.1 RNA polymerase sigma factor SigM [Paenibacillus konkukensis]
MSKSILLLLTGDIRSLDPMLQEQVYKQFYRLVYPMIMYIVKDHQTAEDIIQETFILIIRKSPHDIDEARLNAWLRTVARNATISYLRKNKKKQDELLSDDVYIENAVPLMAERASSTEAEVEAKLLEEAIIQCIHQLKPIYRQVIRMRWLERLSYKEMAEQLGVSEEKIRQTLHRSREAIKKKLQREWKVNEP